MSEPRDRFDVAVLWLSYPRIALGAGDPNSGDLMRLRAGACIAAAIALSGALLAASAPSGPAVAQDLGKIITGALGKGGSSTLSKADVASGLKEALTKAGGFASGKLSLKDGFWGDTAVRIPLPGVLGKVQKQLKPLGLAGPLDDLQLRVNRAAEAAMPQAGKLVGDAVRAITFEDAMAIVRGGDTAATDYLRAKTEVGLRASFQPHFNQALAGSGALNKVDSVVKQYGAGLVKTDAKTWLTDAAMTGALNGLFYYVAREEQAIRRDPVKRTSDILRKVFGG